MRLSITITAISTCLIINIFAGPKNEPVVKAVQKSLPAVVNIYTEGVELRRVRDRRDLFFEQFFGPGYTRGNRIAKVPFRSLGSGLIVSPDGYVVTNYHVVDRANEGTIKITLHDGSNYEAKLIRADEEQDLALVQMSHAINKETPLPQFPNLSLNDLSPNLLGQTVIAIGNPVGYESSVSMGILSAKDRSLQIEDFTIDGLLQTDAAINPGNSGGPLIDIDGNLVGLNTVKMHQSNNAVNIDNIGFAIPGERVKAFVDMSIAIARGEIKEPPRATLVEIFQQKFGLDVQELTPELSQHFGFRPYDGLLITEVEENSPSFDAGLEKGMIIIGINEYRTRQFQEVPKGLLKTRKGQEVKFNLKFHRGYGRVFLGSIVLAAR
ncbi:MAG: trypsin-like peptidase domain-containing protein [Verrucomicrobiota bacterium]